MTSALPVIALTTRTLGSSTGVSQAALDLLLALSRCASSLRVRAWVPRRLPSAVDGLPVGACVLERLGPLMAAQAVLRGEAPPRSLLEHTRLGLLPRARGPLQPAALEVVNGLGAHALHAALSVRADARARVSALVVHESPRHFEQPGRMDMAAALRALRAHDYRVFVSERGRAEWGALAGLDPARSLHIPNCVREQRAAALRERDRAALRRSYGYRDDAVQLVCVGSVLPRKGQDVLVEALLTLGACPLRLDFVGSARGAWAEQLAARVASSALAGRVRFVGEVSDAYERVYAADALVLASRAEASPLSVLEAMALGTCVVAADVDGLAELIVSEQTGLLFAREDPAALAASLRRIAYDPPLRAALGRAGRERYASEFQRARQLARWAEAVTRMLA
jgi:glycosyltransferase involved in cell wall biosynthesis